MKSWKEKYGSWGLVAGAAEGLGKAFSEALANRGMHMILIDNQEEKLYATADTIENKYGIRTKKLLLDLSVIGSLQAIFESIEDLDCRLIVYNAAYGPVKPFIKHSVSELDYYIDLNSRMPLHLTFHFIKNLPEGSSAGIILLSSLAGLYGTNLVAPYGATKAFNFNLAEALYHEYRSKGIDILACCAGATDTPNYRNTFPKYGIIKPSVTSPRIVAESTLKKLGKKGLHIPGIGNRIIFSLLSHIFTRKSVSYLMNKTMQRMYGYRFEPEND